MRIEIGTHWYRCGFWYHGGAWAVVLRGLVVNYHYFV
jgi:hypothetical protein